MPKNNIGRRKSVIVMNPGMAEHKIAPIVSNRPSGGKCNSMHCRMGAVRSCCTAPSPPCVAILCSLVFGRNFVFARFEIGDNSGFASNCVIFHRGLWLLNKPG